MKKNMISAAFLMMALFISFPVLASERVNSLTIDPVMFAWSFLNVDYERSLGDKFSLHAGIASIGDEDLNFTTFDLGGRYYFTESQRGMYIGIDYRSYKVDVVLKSDYQKFLLTGSRSAPAYTLGYKRIIDSGFTWEAGAAYLVAPGSGKENATLPYLRFGWGF